MRSLRGARLAGSRPSRHGPATASLNFRLGCRILRHHRLWVALVMVLAAWNCLWRLSSTVLSDLDEARYGVASSEMLRSHSVLVATYAGRPEYWNLKPPLGYWMQELAFKFIGPTVFALRLPSALCALTLIGLTIWICQRWFGRRQALLAGLILTTCFGFMSYHGARSGDLDSALSLILLVASLQVPLLAQSSRARLLWSGMLSLGFLLKSFAILPFVLMGGLYLLWSGDWRRTRWRHWLPAVAVFSGVVGIWMLARTIHDGSTYFVDRMFREDLLWRSVRLLDNETARPWGYLAVLAERFAPWSLVVLAGFLIAGKKCDLVGKHSRLVMLWAFVPLVALSLARTKHHWYLDPIYPAWSMLAAIASMRLVRSTTPQLRLAALGLLCLALLFCEVRVLRRIGWIDQRPASQTFLLSLRDHTRIPATEVIYAAFAPSNSERFLLEVVDGYRIVDTTMEPMGQCTPAQAFGVLLLRRGRLASFSCRTADWRVLVESRDYAFLERTADDATAALLRRPSLFGAGG